MSVLLRNKIPLFPIDRFLVPSCCNDYFLEKSMGLACSKHCSFRIQVLKNSMAWHFLTFTVFPPWSCGVKSKYSSSRQVWVLTIASVVTPEYSKFRSETCASFFFQSLLTLPRRDVGTNVSSFLKYPDLQSRPYFLPFHYFLNNVPTSWR